MSATQKSALKFILSNTGTTQDGNFLGAINAPGTFVTIPGLNCKTMYRLRDLGEIRLTSGGVWVAA